MSWKVPPKVKLYEALGALADNRVAFILPSEGRSGSSSAQRILSLSSKIADISADMAIGCVSASTFAVRSSSDDKSYAVRVLQLSSSDAGKGGAIPTGTSSSSGGGSGSDTQPMYAVACNDNGSMFQGYLGYPALAVLLYYGILQCPPATHCLREDLSASDGMRCANAEEAPPAAAEGRCMVEGAAAALRGIPWKAIATRHRNNWDAVVAEAVASLAHDSERVLVATAVDGLQLAVAEWVPTHCCRFAAAAKPAKPAKRSRE